MRGLYTPTFALLLCLGVSHAALAQQSSGQPAKSSDQTTETTALSEVVVTAQRRTENLQNVPIAVTALSDSQLKAAGVQNIYDLASVVPSFTLASTSGVPQPRIRGVGNFVNGPGAENEVSVYIDGFYIASASTRINYDNIDHVEVLDGPQGTLFGRNATAGLVQIVTRDPLDHYEGNAEITAANYRTGWGNLYVTGPVADHVSADLAVHVEGQGEGWGTNLATGHSVDQTYRDLSVRSKWKLDLGEGTTARLLLDASNLVSSVGASQPIPGTLISAVNQIAPNLNPWDTRSAFDNLFQVRSAGAGLRIDHDFGGLTLSSLTSYRYNSFHQNVQVDSSPQPGVVLVYPLTDRQFSQELQLKASDPGRLNWVIGAYYFKYESGWSPLNVYVNGSTLFEVVSDNTHNESLAAYGQATYEVLPDTNLTAGLRYTKETRSIDGSVTILGARTPVNNSDLSYAVPTYRVALDHRFSPDILGYLSYNRGFKSGGYNGLSPNDAPYKAEYLSDYEAGLKVEALDHRLRINTGLFFYDYSGIQETSYKVINGALGAVINNAAGAHEYGGEVGAIFKVTPQLTLTGDLSLLHSRFTSFPGAQISVFNPATHSYSVSPGSATGLELPYAPQTTFSYGFDYSIPIPTGTLNLVANDLYSSGYFTQVDDAVRQSSYHLVSASLTWTAPNGRYSVAAWGKNLANAVITNQKVTSATQDITAPEAPRTFGATLGVKF